MRGGSEDTFVAVKVEAPEMLPDVQSRLFALTSPVPIISPPSKRSSVKTDAPPRSSTTPALMTHASSARTEPARVIARESFCTKPREKRRTEL